MYHSSGPVTVVCGANEKFAMPLAVMCYSLLRNAPRRVDIYVLDSGMLPASKNRLKSIASGFSGSLQIKGVDAHTFDGIHIRKRRLGTASLARLLVDRVVPGHIGRLIYIDSDCLVLDDVSKLWEVDIGEAIIGATRDYVIPYFCPHDSRPPTYVHNKQEDAYQYFNAGVMLVNLNGWRRHEVGARSLRYLEGLADGAPFLDQDALNVVCRDYWQPIDFAWNLWPDVQRAPAGCRLFQVEPSHMDTMSSTSAGIAHFAGGRKPWTYEDRDMPYASIYHQYLRASGWFSVSEYRMWMINRALRHHAKIGRITLGRWRRRLTG